MKRFFRLLVVVVAATAFFSGCQKYDDSQIRQEIKDLGERIAALEAWTRNSQEAVDYVAVLKEAVKNMNSIESINDFEDEFGSGYVITFTNKQTIRLYNGEDGDAFFGNVNVGSSRVEFILADGTSFVVDRVTNSIGFNSFETKIVTKDHTVWTVMNEAFTKSEYAAFTAELKTNDGTFTSISTKSASEDGAWKIEAVAPEFSEDGKLVKPAGVIFKETPQAGSRGVLKVALITNDGRESAASVVVEVIRNYLAFEAVEAGATVSMKIVGEVDAPTLEFSTDIDEWITFDFNNPQTITLENVGDKVYWRNGGKVVSLAEDEENYIHFALGDKKIAAQGNIMSLIDKSCQSLTIPFDYCFLGLFDRDSTLVTAPELPATELSLNCYCSLFYGCSSLKIAPELPAINLAESCYYGMFYGCSSLETAPELPAENLEDNCYSLMFTKCESLKAAPELPSEALANDCYYEMFAGCSSLEKAPELPAAKVKVESYSYMFMDCTSLVEAPAISATEINRFGCYGMFLGCTKLKNAPELPAEKLGVFCYSGMFEECTSLETAPELPANTLADYCYYDMFYDCINLKKTPELRATELAPYCYAYMFGNCTSLTETTALPATELAEYCYISMFEYCTSLETAPELPAEILADYCYYSMFWDCNNLKKTPELRATELSPYCYTYMFGNCTSLTETTALPATELAAYCYAVMFGGCTSLEKAPELPAEHLVLACYESLFEDCEKIDHVKVGFTDWGDGYTTRWWLNGTASEGSFEGPEILGAKYGENYIPEGWSFNGRFPDAANKSFAAPAAAKTISNSHRRPQAPKTLKIKDRVLNYKMATP